MKLLASPPRSGWNFIASVRNLFLITVNASFDESLRISTVSPIIFNASSRLTPRRGRRSRLRLWRLLLLLLRRRRSRSRASFSFADFSRVTELARYCCYLRHVTCGACLRRDLST